MTTLSADNDTLARAQSALAEAGCDLAVLSSNTHVTYVSGFAVPPAVGFSAVRGVSMILLDFHTGYISTLVLFHRGHLVPIA